MPRTRYCTQTKPKVTTDTTMKNTDTTQTQNDIPATPQGIQDFIDGVQERQNQQLLELETRLDAMGDEFAAKVRTMVERGLIAARGKALGEIRTIDVSFFLQAPMEISSGTEKPMLEATVEEIQ